MTAVSQRWVLLGAGGMLGRDLATVLGAASSVDLVATTRAEVDVLKTDEVRAAVAGAAVVVNATGWTDVDGAEGSPEAAMAVNGDAVGVIADACAATGARLLHISTDYVFAGSAAAPYAEDAPTDPVNAYGRSKLAGEEHVLKTLPTAGYVVRTAWLYGEHGRNFVSTMLGLAATNPSVDVVDDQLGQPTWSYALAERLHALGALALTDDAPPGIYHGTADGSTTWFGLARAAYELAGLDPARVHPTTSAAFPRPAARPSYSVLGHSRWALAGLPPMADWRTMLARFLAR